MPKAAILNYLVSRDKEMTCTHSQSPACHVFIYPLGKLLKKSEKQIPLGRKSARNDTKKRLIRRPEGQHYPKLDFFSPPLRVKAVPSENWPLVTGYCFF